MPQSITWLPARDALPERFSLRAEKINAVQKMDKNSPDYQAYIDAVNSAFDTRIFNLITVNTELFNDVKLRLKASEFSNGNVHSDS
jgi:hypothetical protein